MVHKLGQLQYEKFLYFDKHGKVSEDAIHDAITLAKEIESQSKHPKYKVGVVIFGVDHEGQSFLIPTVNHIPEVLLPHFGYDDQVADGHPSIHGEMAGLIKMPHNFKHATIAVSRPPCPTCFQAFAEFNTFKPELGIIDAMVFDSRSLSGHDKADPISSSSVKKWKSSVNMLEKVAKKSRIALGLYNPNRRDLDYRVPSKPSKNVAIVQNQIKIVEFGKLQSLGRVNAEKLLGDALSIAHNSYMEDEKKSAAYVVGHDKDGNWFAVGAAASLPPGFKFPKDDEFLQRDETSTKAAYNYRMSALKRAMVCAIKLGITLNDGIIICTQPPVSGMQVNAIGYGMNKIVIPDMALDLAASNHLALHQLTESGVIECFKLKPKNPFLANGNGHKETHAPEPGA